MVRTEPGTSHDARHTGGAPGYVVRRIPPERQPVLDRLAGASRRFQVHALTEFDVTEARARLVDSEVRVTWTGFVVASLARAVVMHPEVNARKAGSRILAFDRVDIGATVEREQAGTAVLDVAVVRDADRRSCATISELLATAKHGPGEPHRQRGLARGLVRLPGPLRRTALRMAATSPRVSATFGPAIGVTSLGMLSDAWAWAVPLAPLTVIATVGRVTQRPAVRDDRIVARWMLPLTLSFDHAVIDGAPAARFTETLRVLIESGAALRDDAAPPGDVVLHDETAAGR